MTQSALILIDLQNDFCTGGSLAVPQGEEVIACANILQQEFNVVVASQDWHPQDHVSFVENHPGYKSGEIIETPMHTQILWPAHCVQETFGAQFHADLDRSNVTKIIQKGTEKLIDSYSAFFDNARMCDTGLADYLKSLKITTLYMMGLATDYCVKYSCLDALSLGFNVYIIQDACKGVEREKGDVNQALQVMQEAGAHLIFMEDVLLSKK